MTGANAIAVERGTGIVDLSGAGRYHAHRPVPRTHDSLCVFMVNYDRQPQQFAYSINPERTCSPSDQRRASAGARGKRGPVRAASRHRVLDGGLARRRRRGAPRGGSEALERPDSGSAGQVWRSVSAQARQTVLHQRSHRLEIGPTALCRPRGRNPARARRQHLHGAKRTPRQSKLAQCPRPTSSTQTILPGGSSCSHLIVT